MHFESLAVIESKMLFNCSSDRSIEMKVKDNNGKITLMCTCYKGYKDVVKYFYLKKNSILE